MDKSTTGKPIIGITIGDINGIGPEIILKTFADSRMLELCTPVIYGSNKILNYYRKKLEHANFNFNKLKDASVKIQPKQINIALDADEEVILEPGTPTAASGAYALKSLRTATADVLQGNIQALVTAPIHKGNTYDAATFPYSGHTSYLKESSNSDEVLMLMVAPNLKVALLTEHLPIAEVHKHIQKNMIINKTLLLHKTLQQDFGISKPKIAVLALNPHAGDNNVIGKEESTQIIPAVQALQQQNILAFGPYAADAFFARNQYTQFDAVLAMYHDQGLIPFKSLAIGEGINFTAGLPFVRTSPDHGTAFDIAGKNVADEFSFREAIFSALDIVAARNTFKETHANPIKKVSKQLLKNAKDEDVPLG